MALWPLVIGVTAVAAYGATSVGVAYIPVTVAAVPILVSLVTFPFLGLVIALAELVGVAFKRKGTKGDDQSQKSAPKHDTNSKDTNLNYTSSKDTNSKLPKQYTEQDDIEL